MVPTYAAVTWCPPMLQNILPVVCHDGDYGVMNKESQRQNPGQAGK
jgi:hypothetical protein